MRFLLDQNRSPRLAVLLRMAGHDAVHALDLGLERADDDVLLAAARRAGHVHLAEDLDAGAVVVIADDRMRVRRLPLLHDS